MPSSCARCARPGAFASDCPLPRALLDGYTDLIQARDDKDAVLGKKRGDLRVLNRKTDQLAKSWYQIARNTFDSGTEEFLALDQIPTGGGTPAPDSIDLNPLEQGGEDGLQVLASYEPGGGDHATTKQIEYLVEGVDSDFGHAAELDPSGNTLGPSPSGRWSKCAPK